MLADEDGLGAANGREVEQQPPKVAGQAEPARVGPSLGRLPGVDRAHGSAGPSRRGRLAPPGTRAGREHRETRPGQRPARSRPGSTPGSSGPRRYPPSRRPAPLNATPGGGRRPRRRGARSPARRAVPRGYSACPGWRGPRPARHPSDVAVGQRERPDQSLAFAMLAWRGPHRATRPGWQSRSSGAARRR